VTGQTWEQGAVLPHLLRENFVIKNFTVEQARDPDAVMAQLESETSCFLWPEDHPVTGEVFDLSPLEEALAKKRIFSIRMSHHAFRTRPLKFNPYAIRLCSVASDLAVAICGARLRTPPWIAGLQPWDAKAVETSIRQALQDAHEAESLVRGFESRLKDGWGPWLQTDSRVWDRACLWHPGQSGEAMMDQILKKIGQQAGPAGQEARVETLQLCRWDGIMKNLDWWEKTPSADQVRGSLILDLSLLDHPEVKSVLIG
jgi:hypothetical protein